MSSNRTAERGLGLAPQALSHDSSPFQTLRRPDDGEIIEFWHGLGARRERHPLRCPACGYVHRWKPEDAWVAQVPMDSTSKSLAQTNKSPDVRKANGARMWER